MRSGIVLLVAIVLSGVVVALAERSTPVTAGMAIPAYRAPVLTDRAPLPLSHQIDPCTLLTDADFPTMHLTIVGRDAETGIRDCQWSGSADVDVTVWDDLGINANHNLGGTAVNHSIGSHEGIEWRGAVGGCVISLAITGTSSVDIAARKCALADTLAIIIEPRLPKG